MEHLNLLLLLAMMLSSMAVAGAALYAISVYEHRRSLRDKGISADDRGSVVFLFDDENLIDATPSARQVLSASPHEGSQWSRLVSVLLPRFPDVADRMQQLVDLGTLEMTSRDGRSRLRAEWRNGNARIRLLDIEREDMTTAVDKLALSALESELGTLRSISQHVPYLTWQESPEGKILWANAAYMAEADRFATDNSSHSWPPHKIFGALSAPSAPGTEKPQRATVKFPGEDEPRWFEVRAIPIGDEMLYTAISAEAIVRAERGQREFVQTLTKTFAHLTVGLAIFDKHRRLALFNPALTDLTSLPIDFLSARPSLQAFVDKLREHRMLPEPKDYKSWRTRLSELEAAALDGTYEETWALTSGQSYRVSGRPQPDGAIAFLFEDISADLSLTRRFRSDLELFQSAYDSIEEAICLFDHDGNLGLSNFAYAQMWDEGVLPEIARLTFSSAMKSWKSKCRDDADWSGIAAAQRGDGNRTGATFEITTLDGRRLSCRTVPLQNGAVLVGFRPTEPWEPAQFRRYSRSVEEPA